MTTLNQKNSDKISSYSKNPELRSCGPLFEIVQRVVLTLESPGGVESTIPTQDFIF